MISNLLTDPSSDSASITTPELSANAITPSNSSSHLSSTQNYGIAHQDKNSQHFLRKPYMIKNNHTLEPPYSVFDERRVVEYEDSDKESDSQDNSASLQNNPQSSNYDKDYASLSKEEEEKMTIDE